MSLDDTEHLVITPACVITTTRPDGYLAAVSAKPASTRTRKRVRMPLTCTLARTSVPSSRSIKHADKQIARAKAEERRALYGAPCCTCAICHSIDRSTRSRPYSLDAGELFAAIASRARDIPLPATSARSSIMGGRRCPRTQAQAGVDWALGGADRAAVAHTVRRRGSRPSSVM